MDWELKVTSGEPHDNDTRMQWEKGYRWEKILTLGFGEDAAIRIGEVVLDGIAMSPDGVAYHDPAQLIPIVEEYKCTSKSSLKSPTDNWKWMMQVKGYCKALGSTKCIFRILHVRDFIPVYAPWELVFTQDELDENWQAILNHKRVMEAR